MILRRFIVLAILAVGFLYAFSGFAAQEPAPKTNDKNDQASALLMNFANFLAQAKQFSVTMKAEYDAVQDTGQKIEFSEVRKITLARPDRIRVDAEQSDGDKSSVLFDGKEITVSSPNQKIYATVSKSGDVDQAVHYLLDDLRVKLPLAMMYVTDLPAEFKSRVRSVDIVENDVMMEVPCTHIAARTDEVDFQFWVPSQGDPLPRRVVITYKNDPGQPQFSANLSEWNLSPNPPEGFFAFIPPQDAHRIKFLAMLEGNKPGTTEDRKEDKK